MVKNKKLLILGANSETIPLVETAKSLGVVTYVADYNLNAPAKKVADIACNIDCMNIEALEELYKKEKIDGVMVGVADSLVKIYAKLCKKLNCPCYATPDQAKILSNKKFFDDECRKFDISTIPNYKVELDNFDEDEKRVTYPLFVKPVDGNSGRGISICENKEGLEIAIYNAKEASFSGHYLVERYMNSANILLYFTFINGDYFLSAIGEKSTIKQKNNGSVVTQSVIYTSKYNELYNEKLKDKLEAMFKDMGIKDGILQISAFIENEEFYLYDPGFRLQGEATDTHIKNSAGFDQKQMLVNFALGQSVDTQILPILDTQWTYVSKWILLKEGIIVKINGIEKLKKTDRIHTINQRLFENDVIGESMIGTERQVFMRIYCRASNDKIFDLLDTIENNLEVLDKDRNSLIIGSNYRKDTLSKCKSINK